MGSKKVRLLRMAIASPGDVQRERDAVQTVASDVNREIAHDLGLHIDVARWETDAIPGFDKEGPQRIIDSELNIPDCDILVGIFWKRFGTPTFGAKSGTEHEITTATNVQGQKQSPHIMLYFNKEPYAPQTADEAEQWTRVLEFRQRYSEHGLWMPYNGPTHFERLFHGNLTRLLIKRFAPAPEAPSEEPVRPDSHELQDRSDYISRYRALISESSEEIVLFTSKLHRSEGRYEAREINTALREARERGVDIRILVADGYDRLPGALELAGDLGIALRFDRRVHFSDVNYACVDKRAAIVAARTPSPPEAGYRHSFSWVEFRSEALASMLVEDFEQQWRSPVSRSVRQYLREILPAHISASSTAKDITRVAHHLAMPEDLVKSYLQAKPPKIFLLGRPGSGKTTVVEAIQDTVKSAGASGTVKWLSDATYLWRVFRASGAGDESVEPTEDGGYFIKDPMLYKKALEDLAKRAKRAEARAVLIILEFSRRNYAEALNVLAQKGVHPDLIVYLDVDLETAILRNRQRATAGRLDRHYVSEREMRTTFLSDDLEQLKETYRGRILVLAEPAERHEPEAVRGHALQILERLKV